ncbi:MAG: peptidoglycan editing factor PgeF [Prevotella sp.]|nr:peptidoglycan editing factor PgeF [Prevotella sp.]
MLRYHFSNHIVAFSTEREAKNANNPYDGFNITHYTGDDPDHVNRCRRELCKQLGIDLQHLVVPHQVHGTTIAEVSESTLGNTFEGVDALITTLPHTCIGISTADCVPILLYDADSGAIAAIHAGWRGTVARIASKTIDIMTSRYASLPSSIEAVIGPSIGLEAFEVGDEVYEEFRKQGFRMNDIATFMNGKWHIDLWQANSQILQEAGISKTHIQTAARCTYTEYAHFFSARRLGIHSGRIFTGIMKKV